MIGGDEAILQFVHLTTRVFIVSLVAIVKTRGMNYLSLASLKGGAVRSNRLSEKSLNFSDVRIYHQMIMLNGLILLREHIRLHLET